MQGYIDRGIYAGVATVWTIVLSAAMIATLYARNSRASGHAFTVKASGNT